MNDLTSGLFKPLLSRARHTVLAVMGVLALALTATTAQAVPLLSGFGGEAGFGELAMQKNDDLSSNELNLPFTVNFFGQTHQTYFINNNGNVTFGGATGTFTPDPFPISGNAMIAPFWGDVDTRCNQCGNVYVASPNAQTVVVTWHNVGYFSEQTNKINNFQLALRDRSADFAPGDFDIEFRYDRLEWTTGDASGGTNGLGGTAAQAGFDAGNQQDFFTLPGSRTDDVLELEHTSNINGGPGGLWSFAIRQGGVPGSSPSNPLMPVVSDAGWEFDFNVELNQQVFIDPEIAIGYDYVVNSGPNFQTVLLPTDIATDIDGGVFELWLWDNSAFGFADFITGGVTYDFGVGGVDRFRILGIAESAGLDATDTTAFVTGLTFASAGQVNMLQIPITADSGPITVPTPSTLMILLLGMGGLGCASRARIIGRQRQHG